MTIVLTGGGSGGHITPILAVADEIKKKKPDTKVIYIGQKGDPFADIPHNYENIDQVYTIRAGKFRRYYGKGWQQIFDVKTLLLNARDFFYLIVGIGQGWRLLRRLKPSVIFIKGGFVGVPVGLSAAMSKIPFVTHDSDAMPGLANRIIAKWAAGHAVALPEDVYTYPKDKTFCVGVPVNSTYQKVTPNLQRDYRKGLSMVNARRVICVIGGGLGAKKINDAVTKISQKLLENYPGLYLIHIVGQKHEEEVSNYYNNHLNSKYKQNVLVKGFVSDLYRYSAAADIVVTRAGATALAEFALQQLACVVVPNPLLTGGHQIKNAEILKEAGAISIVDEQELQKNPEVLFMAIKVLLDSSDKREALAQNLGKFAKANAAELTAELLLKYI